MKVKVRPKRRTLAKKRTNENANENMRDITSASLSASETAELPPHPFGVPVETFPRYYNDTSLVERRIASLAARGTGIAAVYCAVQCGCYKEALLTAARMQDMEFVRVLLLHSPELQLSADEVESFFSLVRPHSLPLAFFAMSNAAVLDPLKQKALLDNLPACADEADEQTAASLRLPLWSLAVDTWNEMSSHENKEKEARFNILEQLERHVPRSQLNTLLFFLASVIDRHTRLIGRSRPPDVGKTILPEDVRLVLAGGETGKLAITAQLSQAASLGLADALSRLYVNALLHPYGSWEPQRTVGYACRQGCELALSIAGEVVNKTLSESKPDYRRLKHSLLKGYVRGKLAGVLPVPCARVIGRLSQV